ncbi:hypothetical protein QBC33DRAFT_530904 [Phialemonium atrogriseum]|uniref:Uncharacterized protein n=1 Tax=Phialemonium atrogriseum TaxID=1093897 RepID=A0AAJ0C4R7_9PEZI|nr:uncharacterized protein QBC33DRAFT_530904 [Phialemonium atrogriseum]KAK1769487.1 hypothetical protein QBC33DRAFT_530904 [Phialemonium atrogriseum]
MPGQIVMLLCQKETMRIIRAKQDTFADTPPPEIATGADSTVDKKKYKANDRRRMKFRPIYRIWVEEFLPRCRAKGLFRPPLPPSPAEPDAATTSTTTTSEHARLLVRDEAFARFPGAGAEYAVRLHEWRAERQRDEILRSVIKGEIPSSSASDPAYRACLVRALREILLPGEQQQGQSRKQHASLGPEAVAALAPARPIRGADGLYDVDAAREFVRDRWEEVGKVAWEAQLARASGQPWGVKLEVEDILEEKVEDKLEEKVEEKGGEKVGEKVGEKEGEE